MFTPLHCSLPFPTFGTLPGYISPSTPPPPDAVTHTFVQPLCLVLFRLLKCSSFCWSPYQHNQMTAAGTELIAKPSLWHQTRRPVQIPSLMREQCFHSNFKVFFLSQLPFSLIGFPRVPQFWWLLNIPHRATNQFQIISFFLFSLKAQQGEKKKAHIFFSHWARVGKLSSSDFCSLLISLHLHILPQHKF